jgi:hypothetical protein
MGGELTFSEAMVKGEVAPKRAIHRTAIVKPRCNRATEAHSYHAALVVPRVSGGANPVLPAPFRHFPSFDVQERPATRRTASDFPSLSRQLLDFLGSVTCVTLPSSAPIYFSSERVG